MYSDNICGVALIDIELPPSASGAHGAMWALVPSVYDPYELPFMIDVASSTPLVFSA